MLVVSCSSFASICLCILNFKGVFFRLWGAVRTTVRLICRPTDRPIRLETFHLLLHVYMVFLSKIPAFSMKTAQISCWNKRIMNIFWYIEHIKCGYIAFILLNFAIWINLSITSSDLLQILTMITCRRHKMFQKIPWNNAFWNYCWTRGNLWFKNIRFNGS